MLIFRQFLIILLSFNAFIDASDIFASLGHMVQLVKTAENITKSLEKFIIEDLGRIEKAKKILGGFSDIVEISRNDPENFVGNPVNSFLLIKKIYSDLEKFVDTLNNFDRLTSMIDEFRENENLPDKDDYEGAIVAIHRLQDTYLLDPIDIRTGNLSKNYPSRPLTAFECFEFGRIAYINDDHYHTFIWMNESLKELDSEKLNPTVDRIKVLDHFAFSTARQGNIQHAIQLTNEILKIDSEHDRAKMNIKYFKKELRKEMEKVKGDTGNPNEIWRDPTKYLNERKKSFLDEESHMYEYLCREENPNILDSRLKCRYISYNPLLYIAPVKEELVNIDPPIWVYHDVLSNDQINAMKSLAIPKLKRAYVINTKTLKAETADYRVSKSAWLIDNEHESFPLLTKQLEAITNLSMDTAELWQIANYGIGGQYDPHYDFGKSEDMSNGNRIATWLYYLEVAEQGGATVFTKLKTKVQPRRGSAVFWLNLLPSGDGDYRTRHAACPVLLGTKWVSNKWLHSGGQEFKRPCNLIREESEEKSS